MKELFAKWRANLEKQSDSKIAEIFDSLDTWFNYTDTVQWPADVAEEFLDIRKSGDRARMIDYILGADPILADGGLAEFLDKEGMA